MLDAKLVDAGLRGSASHLHVSQRGEKLYGVFRAQQNAGWILLHFQLHLRLQTDVSFVWMFSNVFCLRTNSLWTSMYWNRQRIHQEVKLVKHVGFKYGLSVSLNPMLDDYFYSILPITGFKVILVNHSRVILLIRFKLCILSIMQTDE